jgi:23S rRNA (pseudouridine1915-N3)-methyltransferase
MKIRLLAVGMRQPAWVQAGYEEYARRMPVQCRLELIELPCAKRRGKNEDVRRLLAEEGQQMNAAIQHKDRIIALDERGLSWRTSELAQHLARWSQEGRNLALLIGGPDGLDVSCLARAEARWSLSALTLPHGLVRVLVAEQLYRAMSLLQGHPYHRE